jgi:hypothetical protein
MIDTNRPGLLRFLLWWTWRNPKTVFGWMIAWVVASVVTGVVLTPFLFIVQLVFLWSRPYIVWKHWFDDFAPEDWRTRARKVRDELKGEWEGRFRERL